MNKEIFRLTIVIFFVLPGIALADVATSWFEVSLPFLLIIPFIEAYYFRFYSNVVLKLQIKFGRILGAIFIANIVTSLAGFITSFLAFTYNVSWIVSWRRDYEFPVAVVGLALLFSSLIEWVIYIPCFRKSNIRIFDLLRISFVGNVISHLLISLTL